MALPVCELCGGTSFKKEEGMFVCESCGTKYTGEEAKRLVKNDATAATDATQVAVNAIGSAVATAFSQAFLGKTFDPKNYPVDHKDPCEINNYVVAGWESAFDEFKAIEHPTKEQQAALVETTKDCLYALNAATVIGSVNREAVTLVLRNANAMIDAVKDTDYYEEQEDGTFKRNSLPFNTDFKIAGQTESWEARQDEIENILKTEYMNAHPEDAAQCNELAAQIATLEAELGELKDEKKSKGFFNFSAKREVKERMAPVKDQLADLRKQMSAVERRASDDIDARIAQLPGYTRIS